MSEKKEEMTRNIIALVIVIAAIIAIVAGNVYYNHKIHSVTGNAASASIELEL